MPTPLDEIIASLGPLPSGLSDAGLGSRFGASAADSTLTLLEGLSSLGGLVPNPISTLFQQTREDDVPRFKPASGFGQHAAEFLGHAAPDIALGAATAPVALGTKARLASKGVGTLASIAGGELAQSAAILPFDLARKDRSTGEALAFAGFGAAAGTGLNVLFSKLFGRAAQRTLAEAVEEFPEATGPTVTVKGQVKPVSEPEGVQLPLPFEDVIQPQPAVAVRATKPGKLTQGVADGPQSRIFRAITSPERMRELGKIKDPVKRQEALQREALVTGIGELAMREISRFVGEDTAAARFIQDMLAKGVVIEGTFQPKADFAGLYNRVANKVQLNLAKVPVDNPVDAARVIRHELGHYLTSMAGQFAPDRQAQLILERQAAHMIHAIKVLDGAKNNQQALRKLQDLHKLFRKGESPFLDLEKVVRSNGLAAGRAQARKEFVSLFDRRANHFRIRADEAAAKATGHAKGADDFLVGTEEIALHHPFRPTESFGPLEQGAFLPEALRQGQRVPSRVQWGWDEGIADIVDWFGRFSREQRQGSTPATRELVGRLLGTESQVENQLIAETLSGIEASRRRMEVTGRGGLVVDAADPASTVRRGMEIGGQEGARLARVRMLLTSEAPAQLVDGTIVRPGDPAFDQARAETIQRWAMTQDEYVRQLTEGLSKVGGLSAKNVRKLQRSQPFRQFPFQEQFQFDHLARRELKAQGLDRKAQDAALEAMTPGQRQALAMEHNLKERFGPQAVAMMRHVVDNADEHVQSSLINDIGDVIAKNPALGKESFEERLRKARLQNFEDEIATVKKVQEVRLRERARRVKEFGEGHPALQEVDELLAESQAELDRLGAALVRQAEDGSLGTVGDTLDVLTPDDVQASFSPIAERLKNSQSLQQLYDRLVYLYKGNLLLHHATYAFNYVGTLGFGALAPARAFASGAIDAVRGALTGGERTRLMGDAVAETTAWFESTFSSLPGFRRATRTPKDLLDVAPRLRAVREGVTLKNPFRGVEGKIGGLRRISQLAEFIFNGLNAADRWMFNRAFESRIRTAAAREALRTGKPAADILEGWSREVKALSGEALEGAKSAAAKRFAEAMAAGKEAIEDSPQVIKAEADEILNRLVRARPDLAEVVQAQEFGDRLIFTAREGRGMDKLLDGMTQTTAIRNVLEPFLPFRRTVANIMRETVRTSPIGLGTGFHKFFERAAQRESFEAALRDMADSGEIVELLAQYDRQSMGKLMDDLGQAAVGTGMALGTLALIAGGQIQFLPFDRKMPRAERLLREQAGLGTEALVVGDWSVPANRVPPPFAAMIKAGQDVVNLADDDPNKALLAANWTTSFVGNMVDDTFLQGLEGMTSTLRDPGTGGLRFAGQLGGNVLPRFIQPSTFTDIRPAGERSDPITSVGEAFFRGALGRVGLGERQVGALGTERRRTDILGTGIRRRTGQDPIARELVDLGVTPSMGLPRDITLNVSAQNDALQAKGQMQRQILSSIMSNPHYLQWSPEARKRVVERAIRQTNRQANAIIKARAQRGMDINFQSLLEAFRIKEQ